MERPSVLLCLLVCVFGVGSWIDINGLWVETPLLVQSAPEGWTLPSYLVVIIQVANVGPLLFLLCRGVSQGRVGERPVIYLILVVGVVSCILLALFWQHTVFFLHEHRSLPLLLLTLCLAFVDCTSSLVFLPYMALFPHAYLTALYVGEGCSGLLPGLVALVQGVGGEASCVNVTAANGTALRPVYPPPLFSVRAFFCLLAAMLLASLAAFLLIDRLPRFRALRTPPRRPATADRETGSPVVQYSESTVPMLDEAEERRAAPSKASCALLLLFVAWVNALSNGFLPSLQSYASLPFGSTAYHLAVTLANITNPAAACLTFAWRLRSVRWMAGLIAAGTSVAAFLAFLAFRSPRPPLADNLGGKFIMILAWVLLTAIFSYVKTVIGLLLQSKGKKYLTWCGLFTQIGSCVGAIASFLIVNVFDLLRQEYPCS